MALFRTSYQGFCHHTLEAHLRKCCSLRDILFSIYHHRQNYIIFPHLGRKFLSGDCLIPRLPWLWSVATVSNALHRLAVSWPAWKNVTPLGECAGSIRAFPTKTLFNDGMKQALPNGSESFKTIARRVARGKTQERMTRYPSSSLTCLHVSAIRDIAFLGRERRLLALEKSYPGHNPAHPTIARTSITVNCCSGTKDSDV